MPQSSNRFCDMDRNAAVATHGLRDRWPERRPTFKHAAMSAMSHEFFDNFSPDSSDVFILTAPKTGTTLLQQMCQQLKRPGPEVEFEDIYQVSPFLELAYDLGQDKSGFLESLDRPRVFKTHQRLSAIPRGGKYICVVRDPEQTALSWYNFLLRRESPAVLAHRSVDSFIQDAEWFAEGMRYGASLWEYYSEFYMACNLDNVLVLCFEDLIENIGEHLALIGQFIGVPASNLNERVDEMVRCCSKEFMLSHISKFDESWTHRELLRIGRAPEPDAFSASPRVVDCNSHSGFSDGQTTLGTTASLSEKSKTWLKSKWETIVTPATGCSNYAHLVSHIRASQHRLRASLKLEQALHEYDSEDDEDQLMLSSIAHQVSGHVVNIWEDALGTLSSAISEPSVSCWSGGHVWASSGILSEYLESNVDTRAMLADGVEVLELGSGCGLAGIAAMALGGSVTMTDQIMQLPLLRANANRNFRQISKSDKSVRFPRICEYIWGRPLAPPGVGKAYRLVIGSDLFYIPNQAENLTSSILMLFERSRSLELEPPIVLLAHGQRADSYHEFFLSAFRASSLEIKTVLTIKHGSSTELQKNHNDTSRNETTIFRIVQSSNWEDTNL